MSNLEALSLTDSPLPQVYVSTTVVFNILNAYCRRNALDSRIIGTLLGEVRDGNVYVTEAFVVPFKESLEEHMFSINIDYHKAMYQSHRLNNRKEAVVGWFATSTNSGALVVDNSAMIHEVYAAECGGQSPVHLVVDTTLASDHMQVRGFLGRDIVVGKDSLSSAFQELRVHLTASDGEASLLHSLLTQQAPQRHFASSSVYAETSSESDKVRAAVVSLLKLVDTLQQYVDQVVSGDAEANREVGLLLSEAIAAFGSNADLLPVQAQALQKRYQDLLMVAYLASLTQTQTTIAERVNQIL